MLSYNPKDVRDQVFQYLQTVDVITLIDKGVRSLIEWTEGDYHDSKEARIQSLLEEDLWEICSDITLMICCLKDKVTLVTAASMLAPKLKLYHQDKFQGIYLAAEIITMFADSDIYDVTRQQGYSAWVEPNVVLPQELMNLIVYSIHSPPCSKPKVMTHNRDSVYEYQVGTSLLLGGAVNHHSGNICLDVLNIQSQVRFSINEQFIESVEETQDLDPSEYDVNLFKEIQLDWARFLEQSHEVYQYMLGEGNSFAFQHRYDKRGRMYSHGFHLNIQGSSFKKAMLDFNLQLSITVEYSV